MVTVVALRNATTIWVLLDVSRIKKCAGLAGGRARPVFLGGSGLVHRVVLSLMGPADRGGCFERVDPVGG